MSDRGPGDDAVERLARELVPRVLGAVVRRFGDFAAAEDAVQEALLAAVVEWRRSGAPENPGGWLYRVASRRMIDGIERDDARRRREAVAAERASLEADRSFEPDGEDGMAEDDSLCLFLMCCHPALTPPSAIALTLRALGGLTTREIACAFLVPEATMSQRIHRAKQSIEASGLRFELPSGAEREERWSVVRHVLYLIFSEGYAGSAGPQLVRVELAAEAIRLARVLRRLQPDDAETAGLLALMLLTDARRPARTGPQGELIPLDEQVRALWDRAAIDEGTRLVEAAMSKGSIGPYQIQAAIAALHDEAPSAEATDWPQILALYGLLERITGNPMVALNRAVAAAMVHGPTVGLELIEAIEADRRIAGHYRIDAVRGHLLERAGDPEAASQRYLAAARRTASLPERHYLMTRAARLRHRDEDGGPPPSRRIESMG
jgi:RNA polymerase sigma factor (sigma-70 family)